MNFLYIKKLKMIILQVRTPIRLSTVQSIVELPTANINIHASGTVYGWGLIHYANFEYPRQIQFAPMTVFPSELCSGILDIPVGYGQFCGFNQESVGPCIVSI
jgi:hypothetical protein